MLGPTLPEHARIKLKRLDPKGRRREVAVAMQPLGDPGRGILRAAGDRDVRLKPAHVEIDPRANQRIVEALPELKQPRVPGTSPHPDDAWRALRRERSHRFDRQKKGLDPNGRDAPAHSGDPFGRDIAEKSNGHVKLLRAHPGNPVKRLREGRHRFAHGIRKGEGKKKPLGVSAFDHRLTRMSRSPILSLPILQA